jgi:hypothetical protein
MVTPGLPVTLGPGTQALKTRVKPTKIVNIKMGDFFIYFLFSKRSRNRVKSTRIKRITPHDSLDCHPSTF